MYTNENYFLSVHITREYAHEQCIRYLCEYKTILSILYENKK